MKDIKYYLLIGLAFLFYACAENEDNTPSFADNDRLEGLIDTDIEYINNFKKTYGTYILYNFDQAFDFSYQFEEAEAWNNAVITKLNKDEVEGALDFLHSNFFSCYADDIIKEYFPRKLLICSKIYANTLGISTVTGKNYHAATASINGITIANLDKESINGLNANTKNEYIKNLHFIYIAGYLINIRNNYFVRDSFFEYGTSLYRTLIDPNRVSASNISDEFFYEKGFFHPEESSATYYGNAEEDLVLFTKNLILMDQNLHDVILKYDIMTNKARLVVNGLKDMGIDVNMINPLMNDFL